MQVSYGPPGQRGVTHLMAVGDAELEPTAAGRAVDRGRWVALGAIGLGFLIGSPLVRNLGAGALVALLGVAYVSRQPRTVEVSR